MEQSLKLSHKNWRTIYGLSFCVFLCICVGCSEKDFVSQALDCEEQGDYEKAIAYWDKAISRNPHDARYYNNRGSDKQELKDYIGAIKDCNMALQIDSFLIYGYTNRAGSKYILKDYVGALKDYNTALKIYTFKTEHLQIKFLPLTSRLPFGNRTIADDDLMEAPQYQINDILIDRAQVYYQMDSLNLALNDFTACIEEQFCLSFCFYWRACIYYKMGNTNKAYDDLKQVLRYADRKWEWESEIALCALYALEKGLGMLNCSMSDLGQQYY